MIHLTHFDRQGGAPAAGLRAAAAAPGGRIPLLKAALAYAAAAAAFLIVQHGIAGGDYVGFDNDDVMRLVEVRDFLGGQNWFDMHQYRLGLAGGTLMHWSRLIDLPIAALIASFSLVLPQQAAEAVALTVWPSLMLVPLLLGVAIGGARLGGRAAMHIALALATLYAVAINRFEPGAIDHTNVQLALMALYAAMLIDTRHRPASFAAAGLIAGVAIAIGAETTPEVAVGCLAVAVSWAWTGAPMARAAQSFGLVFAATLTAAFYLLVPPGRYSAVTCDALSTGFYSLGTVGGGLLFLAASLLAGRGGRALRFGALAVIGVAMMAMALIVAPQCLASPLAGLDPLLRRLWLDHVTEAQPIAALFRAQPFTAAAFYATPALAITVCLREAWRGCRRAQHLVLLALLGITLAITVVEVRGSVFANLTAFIVMGAAIARARASYLAAPKRAVPALAFVAITLASVPAFWSVGGALAAIALAQPAKASTSGKKACATQEALAPLTRLHGVTVAAPSNLGVDILRYTDDRVLSAPYHRNQAGMLAELRIGLAKPEAAERLLADAGVSVVAYCSTEAETRLVENQAREGLFATLKKGDVPAYLTPFGDPSEPLKLYRFTPAVR